MYRTPRFQTGFQINAKPVVSATGFLFGAWKGQVLTVARDTRLDRIVAVKIPRRDRLTPEEADRFLMEAQAAAQLQHPGIVGIHDTGYRGTTVYIATDFIEGKTLDAWMESRILPSGIAAEICAQVADALHRHDAGQRWCRPSRLFVGCSRTQTDHCSYRAHGSSSQRLLFA